MKLLFDQNISYRILKKLPDFYSESSHVKTEDLFDVSDIEIWEYAKYNEFTIVSLDSDFNDINVIKGFPPKIIWIKTGNLDIDEIAQLLEKHRFEIEALALKSGSVSVVLNTLQPFPDSILPLVAHR
jgi:predicted nuclease of predicted toxin-antitoxin system